MRAVFEGSGLTVLAGTKNPKYRVSFLDSLLFCRFRCRLASRTFMSRAFN